MNVRAEAARILSSFAKASVHKIVQESPALFLAYASIRRSLRSQYALRRGLPSTVIIVTGATDMSGIYRKAADLFLNGSAGVWARSPRGRKALVHVLATSHRRKVRGEDLMEKHGKFDVILVLVRTRAEIPAELALTVDAIVDIMRPTPRQIHAVRRLLGREPFDNRTAEMLVDVDLPFLAPIVSKRRLSQTDALTLLASSGDKSVSQGPRLEELPGFSAVKVWAKSFINDLNRFRKGKLEWSEMARGVLLHGPPGTGKTLFARAFAQSSGLPLISTSVTEWQSAGHLGNLLAAMRTTFETARATQPSIVFIDELDSIGDRGTFTGDYVEYRRQVVNQLLECIDGAQGRDQILVIGATNYPDTIDPALLRSGRIERHVRLDLPDVRDRTDILQFHMGISATGNEMRDIAVDLDGWSPADLEMLAREARARGRQKNRPVQIVDLFESLPPMQQLSEDDARRVATHEAGHAVVGLVLFPGCRISIMLRRSFRLFGSKDLASGLTKYEHDDESLLPTRHDYEDLICRILAGAAAEEFMMGAASIGFSGSVGSDLDTASVLAMRMVCSYGMGENLRFVIESHRVDTRKATGLPFEARSEISRILDQQYARARSILADNASFLSELAAELLEKQRLGAADVMSIASRNFRTAAPA